MYRFSILFFLPSYIIIFGLPRWLSGKESTYQAGAVNSIPGLGTSPGEKNGNPLQCLCLEIPWIEEPGGL